MESNVNDIRQNLREEKTAPKSSFAIPEENENKVIQNEKESKNEDDDSIQETNNVEDKTIQEFNQYKEEMIKKINEIKAKMNEKLKIYEETLNKQCETFEHNLNSYYVNESERLNQIINNAPKSQKEGPLKVAENFVEIAKKKIGNYISFQETIQSSIDDHFNILNEYLSDPFYIKNENPVKAFVNKNNDLLANAEIAKKIPSEIIFVPKSQENKKGMKINKDDDLTEIRKLLIENKDDYYKLSCNSLSSENFFKIFTKIPKNEGGDQTINPGSQFTEIEKLKLKKCTFEEIELNQYFPNLSTLKLKLCPYIYGSFSCVNYLSKLKKLYLRNLNLTNNTFESIIGSLLSNDEIRNHLRVLSCANNKITKVEMFCDGDNTKIFRELKELDFEDNKIYQFCVENFGVLKRIRFINLTSNNFAFEENFNSNKLAAETVEKQNCKQDGGKPKKILILITKNLFVLKGVNRENYFSYLNEILPTYDYPLRSLTFETLFNLHNKTLLSNLIISSTLQNNLKELNFSLCSLSNEDLINLLEKNSALLNLKKLNVSFNFLTDNLFGLFNERKIENILTSLETLDLTGNENVEGSGNFDKLAAFVKTNKKLKKIILIRTKFESNLITNLIRYKQRELKKNEGAQQGAVQMPINPSEGEKQINSDMTDFLNQFNQGEPTNVKLYFREISKSSGPKIRKAYPDLMKYFEFRAKVQDLP